MVGGAAGCERAGREALLVGRERDGWMVELVNGREWDGCMVGGAAGWERAGRLHGGWRCWLGESGTAAWWVVLLVGRERDGWMVGGAAGWERAGRLHDFYKYLDNFNFYTIRI